MSIPRKLKAEKVTITAGKIDEGNLKRQTENHKAQSYKARDDVEIVVEKQYPNSSKEERPDVGTVIKGDRADITTRKTITLEDDGKRKRKTFIGNVTATVFSGRRRGSK